MKRKWCVTWIVVLGAASGCRDMTPSASLGSSSPKMSIEQLAALTPLAQEHLSSDVEVHDLTLGGSSPESFASSPAQASGASVELSQAGVGCSDTIADALNAGGNSILLLSRSKVVIARPAQPASADGSTPAVLPQAAISCDLAAKGSDSSRELNLVSTDTFQVRNLSVGKSILDDVVSSSGNFTTVVSCVDRVENRSLKETSGIYLSRGSKIVMTRDPDFVTPDGRKLSAAFAVVTCN